MDFRHQVISLDSLAGIAADALLLVMHGDALDATVDPVIAGLVNDAVAQGDFKFKSGRTLYLHRPAGVKASRLVVSVAKDGEPQAFKAAVASGLGALKSLGAKHVAIALGGGVITDAHAEAFVNASADACYIYRQTKPSAPPAPTFTRFTLVCAKADVRGVTLGLTRGRAIAEGVLIARECANLPSNIATPTYLAEQAQKIGKTHGLKVEVLDRKAIEKLGMGAFLAVTQGSVEPPRFIVARYDGAPKGRAPVVLVGKGITFDTGGISIKPAPGMDEMKYDMGGAASVLGTLEAIAILKPKLNLVCLIPTCENMPSGTAIKPGDVVTSMSGQTIEILNTDAEGRLILCDALTYAERFKPAVVVDIATLTGACVVALGHHFSGLFTEDDTLAEELGACSRAAQDPCWRMPLDDAYDEGLKSNFADMGNVGPREGGAITAAMFLRRYTAKYRWAHLDVAGTAWKGGASKGSTGRPVPLLTHFVLSQVG